MAKKSKNAHAKLIIGRILLGLVCAGLIFVYYWSWYVKKQQDKLELNSRYTFTVTIDGAGNVIDSENGKTAVSSQEASIEKISVDKVADIWLDEFLNQFTQKYVPRAKALKSVEKKPAAVLDSDTNTVLVSFSAVLKNSESEFFSSWDGIINEERFQCEWVITYELENHFDNTATIHVAQILSSEAYGISMYNQSLNQNSGGNVEVTSNAAQSLAAYEIKNNTLYVTYDGEKMITVPIDCNNLPMAASSTSGESGGLGTTVSDTELKAGSYQISTSMTAFLYGGATVNGKKIPLTLCYSNDKGINWITCEIDKLYTADYFYVKFLDDKNGVIVCGYDRNENVSEASKIYMTKDGGETWNQTGSGPATNIIKGVIFIDENIGYFCYNYVEGMDSNLYVTRDAGQTFSKVVMEPQELDSTAANASTEAAVTGSVKPEDGGTETKLEWGDVYKEAMVPIYDDNGILTIYLTQGSNGVYNSGKTAARYQSADKGLTWKYIGQLEITSEKK
ncbi:MAG: exo-alpha-sialidase [Eubacteriales bacterium]|nr:exo-alpha-sialidase [Eubacteriales bacterium]